MKLEQSIILDYYLKEIRPLAEHGVIVWNSGLTKAQINNLEKIQKVAFLIILGHGYKSYESACNFFEISTLSSRRTQLCENFAIKLFKSKRRDEYFTLTKPSVTRQADKLVQENICRTTRCFNAPHNYLNRLVNQNADKILRK